MGRRVFIAQVVGSRARTLQRLEFDQKLKGFMEIRASVWRNAESRVAKGHYRIVRAATTAPKNGEPEAGSPFRPPNAVLVARVLASALSPEAGARKRQAAAEQEEGGRLGNDRRRGARGRCFAGCRRRASGADHSSATTRSGVGNVRREKHVRCSRTGRFKRSQVRRIENLEGKFIREVGTPVWGLGALKTVHEIAGTVRVC